MARQIRLNHAVRPIETAPVEDLGQVRWAMSRLGLFDPRRDDPRRHREDHMSPKLARALRSFQAGQGLREDAVLRPGGPTEGRLNRLLEQGRGLGAGSRDGVDLVARERLPGALAGRVGRGQENHPVDVATVGGALRRLGHVRPGASRPFTIGVVSRGLRRLQRAAGLPHDGIITPGGPTEEALSPGWGCASSYQQSESS